jgi:glycine/D-amino acid oxidase-like deaminating enzyme
MKTTSVDVIVVGGGFAGLAIAWQVARRGASVLLFEADKLGGGASGACAGRAQVAEGPPGPHMALVLAGLARLEALEEELGCPLEWRRLGNLILIEHERHWQPWNDQVAYLRQLGVPAEMLDAVALAEAEPLLRPGRWLGAAWCLEGHLNPLKLIHAYAAAARRGGAELRQQTPVTGFRQAAGRVTAVETTQGVFSAGAVVITAGAWTGALLAGAGIHLPVQFTQAEAAITEPLPLLLRHHVGLADFYETIHHAARAVSIGVAQQINGTLLVTEAVEQTPAIRRTNSAWCLPAIAHDLLTLFPALAGVRLMRAWAAASPFLPDEQPAIGPAPGLDNVFVATCFHLAIPTLPVFSEALAGVILGEGSGIDLGPYSPARFGVGQFGL